MSTLELIQLIIIAVVALVFLIWFLINAIKNKWITQLIQTVDSAIKEAEEKQIGDGNEKKKYVMNKVEKKCEELKIPYNIISKVVSKLIDITIKHYNVIAK